MRAQSACCSDTTAKSSTGDRLAIGFSHRAVASTVHIRVANPARTQPRRIDMSTIRTAKAEWKGGVPEGAGTVALGSGAF
ncbi:MAG: hypothetical protein ABI650_03110, partial [Dokdonella sp.]